VTTKATVKGIDWRRRLGCRARVSKVLSVALEPMLSMRTRDSASRSPAGKGGMRGDDGLKISFICLLDFRICCQQNTSTTKLLGRGCHGCARLLRTCHEPGLFSAAVYSVLTEYSSFIESNRPRSPATRLNRSICLVRVIAYAGACGPPNLHFQPTALVRGS